MCQVELSRLRIPVDAGDTPERTLSIAVSLSLSLGGSMVQTVSTAPYKRPYSAVNPI